MIMSRKNTIVLIDVVTYSSAFGDTANSRYYETKLAFITFVAAAHTQWSHLLLSDCGMSVALADSETPH